MKKKSKQKERFTLDDSINEEDSHCSFLIKGMNKFYKKIIISNITIIQNSFDVIIHNSEFLVFYKNSVNGIPKLNPFSPSTEIVKSMAAWLSTEKIPQHCDVEILSDYLQQLIQRNEFESFNFVIDNFQRYLKRCIFSRTNRRFLNHFYSFTFFLLYYLG